MSFAPLGFWLDRWCADLPEVSATVGRVVALAKRGADGYQSVESIELSPSDGVVGDGRGPLVYVARAAAIEALAEDRGCPWTSSGDQVYVELDLARAGLPEGSALTSGDVILGVRPDHHGPDSDLHNTFGGRAARRIRRQNRLRGPGRRLACSVIQPGRLEVGQKIFAKAIGIRFQP